MSEQQMKIALENIARRGTPNDINLWPNISARLERKQPMFRLLSNPLTALMITLLLLAILSGAAYALGIALGYIPGLGVVEQNTPFYVLAEPVSQTREGVTVTVQKAVLNGDQLLVVFKVADVPSDKHSFLVLPESETCRAQPEIHFSSGEKIRSLEGNFSPFQGGYESQNKFSGIPSPANNPTLIIPCIQGALEPGILPENWELPLHFEIAPPQTDLKMTPALVITPSEAPKPAVTPSRSITPTPSSERLPSPEDALTVLQAIDIGDSYIIVGAFTPPQSNTDETGFYAIDDFLLRDSAGEEIGWQPSGELNLTPYIVASPGKDVWAIKLTKNFTPPLDITYRTRYIYSPASQNSYKFEFDAGTNPQAGQDWEMDQDFQLAGHQVRLTKISAGYNSYTFYFQSEDENVESVGMHGLEDIKIEGFQTVDFAGNFGLGNWSLTKVYTELPKGKLNIIISGIYLYGDLKDWTMEWQP